MNKLELVARLSVLATKTNENSERLFRALNMTDYAEKNELISKALANSMAVTDMMITTLHDLNNQNV